MVRKSNRQASFVWQAFFFPSMDDIRRLARFFRPYKWSLIIGIACIVAGVVFNVAIPQIVGRGDRRELERRSPGQN